MKKLLNIAVISALLCACGSSSEKQKQETAAEEDQAVEAISSDLEASQEELKSATDKSLDEIDSLLQNVE